MNRNRSSTENGNKYENEFSDFLIQRIQNVGGSIKLQHITGHLSQLSSEVRKNVGTTAFDLRVFLEKHSNLFNIKNDIVTLVDSSVENFNNHNERKIEAQNLLPQIITGGKGIIVKLLPEFGFLNSKEPIKTSVFFRAEDFGDKNIDLTNFGLNIGTMVYFDAKKESNDKYSAKYRATKVWTLNKTDENGCKIIQKTRKSRATGLYDPPNISGEGSIQKIFPNLGFIAVDGDEKNTVFFYKNRVANYNNIVDLTTIFERGEVVEFNAHRSTKQDAKARWEAIKVWKKSGKMCNSENIIKCVSSNPEDSLSQSCSESSHNFVNRKINNYSKEIIKNERGKICPRSQGAVIKFGEKLSQLVDGDSSTYFICGHQVHDISWEFSDGDDVWFDAVKIKSAPGWKAILVWTGEKPDINLPISFGDFPDYTDEELDEIPENCSYTSKSSLSEISYESTKSASVNSEQYKLKTNRRNKQKSAEYDDIPCKLTKMSNSDYKTCSSFTSSQNSLCSSTESKQFQESRKRYKENITFDKSDFKKSVLNWGDSPYPAENDYQSVSLVSSKDDIPDMFTEQCSISISDDKVDNEMEFSEEYLKNSIEKCKLTEKPIDDHNVNLRNSLKDVTENEFRDDVNLECKNNIEKKANIKIFKNISGKVTKVYSKFAEVESPKFQKPLAFFWNTLYCNGNSVDDLHLDDLKEVINVGDNINFNYFEIVDDLGQFWQKITMVWTGIKPKATETTPDEFIKQNQLSVTVNDDKSFTENLQVAEGTTRKFLTVISDSGPDCDIEECISVTESCAESEPFPNTVPEETNLQSNDVPEFETLTNVISQMLLSKLFVSDSEVDVKMLSTEIINLVLQFHEAGESDRSLQLSWTKEEILNRKSDFICSTCENSKKLPSQSVNRESAEVQTIITGEIIAQNIFTEC